MSTAFRRCLPSGGKAESYPRNEHQRAVTHPGARLGGASAGPLLPVLRASQGHVHPPGLCRSLDRTVEGARGGCPQAFGGAGLHGSHRVTRRARRRGAQRHPDVSPLPDEPGGCRELAAHVPGDVERRPALRSAIHRARALLLPRLPVERLLLRPRAGGRVPALARRREPVRARSRPCSARIRATC
jgi:hypothetical protein